MRLAPQAGLSSAYGPGQPAWTTWKVRSAELKHTIDYIFVFQLANPLVLRIITGSLSWVALLFSSHFGSGHRAPVEALDEASNPFSG